MQAFFIAIFIISAPVQLLGEHGMLFAIKMCCVWADELVPARNVDVMAKQQQDSKS